MKKLLVLFVFSIQVLASDAQSLYFPPLTGDTWDTLSPSSLGWCAEQIDSMYDMLEQNNTKAFIVLKEGKIVLEKYFGTFERDSAWYWASAGKSLTSILVGVAQQEGLLSISDKTSDYLGQGWTLCSPLQEEKITIRHQLTMTTGLDDNVPDPYCTTDTCLHYLQAAGTRWAYHNAPYTLLDGVIEIATGMNLNNFFQQRIRSRTGINGLFLPSGYNNIFYSKARSMARYGLLILNKGNWNGNQILTDTAYFNQMVNTSQNLNLSYGYLWWLNGKASFMLPTLQFVFPGSLMPDAPDDMISALGKNGQYINVVPSLHMVVIRMGNAPEGGDVPVTLDNVIWQYINHLECGSTSTQDASPGVMEMYIYPNPSQDEFTISIPGQRFDFSVFDLHGTRVFSRSSCFDHQSVDQKLASGMYWVKVVTAGRQTGVCKLIVGIK